MSAPRCLSNATKSCPSLGVATSPDRQYYRLERWQEAWKTLNASSELQAEYRDHAWCDALVPKAKAAEARAAWKQR
mgnify:FL=1